MYKYNESLIEKNHCYNNIFNVSTDIFTNDLGKIAYGYMGIGEGIFVRHGFALNHAGEVIDPTFYLLHMDKLPSDVERHPYIVLKTFDTMNEYLDELKNNKSGRGYDLDMRWTLNQPFREFILAMHMKAPMIFVD